MPKGCEVCLNYKSINDKYKCLPLITEEKCEDVESREQGNRVVGCNPSLVRNEQLENLMGAKNPVICCS